MKVLQAPLLALGFVLLTAVLSPLHAAPAQAARTGIRFTVSVISSASPTPVQVITYILDDQIRTESTAADQTTVAITTEGKTYLLNPDLKLAQSAPVKHPEANLPASEARWWALADPLQVVPTRLPALFKSLGAHSLGTDKLEGAEVEAWVLNVPADLNFPLNNLRLYVDAASGAAVRMDYQRGQEESVQVRFVKVEEGIPLDPSLFRVPKEYKLVEYEW